MRTVLNCAVVQDSLCQLTYIPSDGRLIQQADGILDWEDSLCRPLSPTCPGGLMWSEQADQVNGERVMPASTQA